MTCSSKYPARALNSQFITTIMPFLRLDRRVGPLLRHIVALHQLKDMDEG